MLFVAALSTIIPHYFKAVAAVNDLALVAIGNLAVPARRDPDRTRKEDAESVVAVTIDLADYERIYKGRSPIDRCALAGQLQQIYEISPRLDALVIDIDLSPQLPDDDPLLETRLRICESGLYDLIGRHEDVKTVLLMPRMASGVPWNRAVRDWISAMRSLPHVSFGEGAIPVRFGMSNEYLGTDGTLCAEAERALEIEKGCRTDSSRIIDPGAYLYRVRPFPTSWAVGADGLGREVAALLPRQSATPEKSRRIVFFGIGEGEIDTFQTPIGRVYGVQLHAAAFATQRQPAWLAVLRLPLDIILDLVSALTVGCWVGACWQRYFRHSRASTSSQRAIASAWILAMLGGLALIGAVLLVIALWLMRCGIWFTPVPIMLGMFVEGCMKGPVDAARPSPATATPTDEDSAFARVLGPFWPAIMFMGWLATVIWGFWLIIGEY